MSIVWNMMTTPFTYGLDRADIPEKIVHKFTYTVKHDIFNFNRVMYRYPSGYMFKKVCGRDHIFYYTPDCPTYLSTRDRPRGVIYHDDTCLEYFVCGIPHRCDGPALFVGYGRDMRYENRGKRVYYRTPWSDVRYYQMCNMPTIIYEDNYIEWRYITRSPRHTPIFYRRDGPSKIEIYNPRLECGYATFSPSSPSLL